LDNSLHEKLIAVEASLPEIEKQLSEMDISSDQKAYAEMAKKHSDVSAIVELFREWKEINLEIADAEELFQSESDEEMKSEFEEIISENKFWIGFFHNFLSFQRSSLLLTQAMKIFLLPCFTFLIFK